jgi:predicted amidohydrolase
MSHIQIALLQMTASGHDRPGYAQESNLAKGEEFCRRAKHMGADIALFPEMWNIGCTFFDPKRADDRQKWIDQAVGEDDEFVVHFKKLAREMDMALAITYLEKWPGAPRNTAALIDRHGEVVLTYAKVHTCDFDKEAHLTPGDDFYVVSLDTKFGDVKIGVMICFDREFPESARILMLKGAEIILTPNACDMEENRIGQLRARAYENMLAVALTNYAAPQANGHSVAFDGMAFNQDESSRDTMVIEAGEGEGVYMARIDIERLRSYRAYETWGDAFRRPGLYGHLTSNQVNEPFKRPEARR